MRKLLIGAAAAAGVAALAVGTDAGGGARASDLSAGIESPVRVRPYRLPRAPRVPPEHLDPYHHGVPPPELHPYARPYDRRWHFPELYRHRGPAVYHYGYQSRYCWPYEWRALKTGHPYWWRRFEGCKRGL